MRYQFGMIPAELRALRQWVCWKTVVREGKPTKVLITPKSGDYARTHNQEGKTYRDTPEDTWDTFDSAIASYNRSKGNYDGIGFVFTADDPYCGVDVDDSREHGKLSKEAERIVRQLDSYSELSPSGTGVHVIVRACLPPSGRRKGHVEMYDQTRYFTMTGLALPGHLEIRNRQVELHALHESIFGKVTAPDYKPLPAVNLSLTDAELIEKARGAKNGGKFQALYDFGCVALYDGDDSRADLALCGMLAFFTGPDESKIDRLMRSSALYRKKWDRDDYSRRTIAKVLQGKTEFYSPNGHERDQPSEVREEPSKEYHPTQDGDALRLLDRYGEEMRVFGTVWRVWDGVRWAEAPPCEVMERIRTTCNSVFEEVARAQDKDVREKIFKHGLRTESAAYRQGVEKIAKNRVHVYVKPDLVDAHDFLLNASNGTINLKNGCIEEPRREHLLTKMTPVEYDPSAESTLWEGFLRRVIPDAEVREFVQRAAGYALTGDVSEQCFFFLFGSGKNGKSVFLKTLIEAMGEYASVSTADLLLEIKSERLRPEIADLKGRRLVTTIEIADGRKLAENLVKQLTGGDRINARFLYEKNFEFDPTHKIFIAANHRPVVKGTDFAIWRRIMLVPFTETIPDSEADPHLSRKLKAELPGVLNWCVQGCLMWQTHGLQPPESVKHAVEEYRAEQDVTQQFIDEACECGTYKSVNATVLYQAYRQWCLHRGEEPTPIQQFGRVLTDKGFQNVKQGGQVERRGINLKGESLV